MENMELKNEIKNNIIIILICAIVMFAIISFATKYKTNSVQQTTKVESNKEYLKRLKKYYENQGITNIQINEYNIEQNIDILEHDTNGGYSSTMCMGDIEFINCYSY